MLAVDGSTGTVVVEPTPEQLDQAARRSADRAARLAAAHGPGRTRDGEPRLTLALFSGQLTAAEVADLGLRISGDASVPHRVLPEPVPSVEGEKAL